MGGCIFVLFFGNGNTSNGDAVKAGAHLIKTGGNGGRPKGDGVGLSQPDRDGCGTVDEYRPTGLRWGWRPILYPYYSLGMENNSVPMLLTGDGVQFCTHDAHWEWKPILYPYYSLI